jgi:hypothetical protein
VHDEDVAEKIRMRKEREVVYEVVQHHAVRRAQGVTQEAPRQERRAAHPTTFGTVLCRTR